VCSVEQVNADASDAGPEVTDVVDEDAGQISEDHEENVVDESNVVSQAPCDDVAEPVCGETEQLDDVEGEAYQQALAMDSEIVADEVQNAEEQIQTAVNHVEINVLDEETPQELVKDADESTSTAKVTKPDQTSTKTGNSRARNTSNKKIWKPAGPLNAMSTQPNKKEAGSTGASSRGKPYRQGNAPVPTRLPPIAVSGVGSNERRRQQAPTGDATGRGGNGLTAGRVPPGRLYKCSATACVTVLSQPAETTAANGGNEASSGSADFPNQNRKYIQSEPEVQMYHYQRQSSTARRHRCYVGNTPPIIQVNLDVADQLVDVVCQPEPEVHSQNRKYKCSATITYRSPSSLLRRKYAIDPVHSRCCRSTG